MITGRCECAGVSFRVDGPLRDVFNCHCGRCRRFSGHHVAGTRAAREDVEMVDTGTLRWYSPEPSVAYGFCSRCGSSLFWTTTARPEGITIMAGTLDQPTGLTTTTAWWVAEHADYHPRVPGLVEHDHDG
jgi:hypothetical protein